MVSLSPCGLYVACFVYTVVVNLSSKSTCEVSVVCPFAVTMKCTCGARPDYQPGKMPSMTTIPFASLVWYPRSQFDAIAVASLPVQKPTLRSESEPL